MRENITLACTECKQRNYETSKNKKTNSERIDLVVNLLHENADVFLLK